MNGDPVLLVVDTDVGDLTVTELLRNVTYHIRRIQILVCDICKRRKPEQLRDALLTFHVIDDLLVNLEAVSVDLGLQIDGTMRELGRISRDISHVKGCRLSIG